MPCDHTFQCNENLFTTALPNTGYVTTKEVEQVYEIDAKVTSPPKSPGSWALSGVTNGTSIPSCQYIPLPSIAIFYYKYHTEVELAAGPWACCDRQIPNKQLTRIVILMTAIRRSEKGQQRKCQRDM